MTLDNVEDENKVREKDTPKGLLPPPFDIQLVEAFPVEIVARRFPVPISEGQDLTAVAANFSLENGQVNEESHLAQVILAVKVGFQKEPRFYEISFGLLGLFTYNPTYPAELVHSYLVEQGPLSILLPFARELLVSLCNRIRIPPLFIPMYPIASPESQEES